jgi:hypothetical protein
MEQEQNRAVLKKAILALPSYHPPEGLWHDIEHILDEETSLTLNTVIKELPQYQPPVSVWNHISDYLDEPEVKKPRRLSVLSSSVLSKAAAVALILVSGYLALTLFTANGNERVRYAEGVIQSPVIDIDYQEDEPMIQMVSQAFEESPVARQQKEFSQLKSTLEELNEAKIVILEMIANYGEDPQMIKELADIERSRTDVVMKMARFI